MNKEIKRAKSPGRSRFLMAGLGAFAPVLLNLAVVDFKTLMPFETLSTVSYVVRVGALFVIGGLVGWLHRTEVDPVKLFMLGIGAPALITGAINGKNIPHQDSAPPKTSLAALVIGQAYAQSPNGAKTFSMPEESAAQQISRGLLGTRPTNVFFVIVDSRPTEQDAQTLANELTTQGFPAEVYRPIASNPNYAVVIGSQMPLPDAQALRARAITAGLSGAYIWTFPPD